MENGILTPLLPAIVPPNPAAAAAVADNGCWIWFFHFDSYGHSPFYFSIY